MRLLNELRALLDEFARDGIEYALCGGLALAVHGHARATKDIDLLVLRADLDRAVAAAGRLGFTIDAGNIPFDVAGPREREVRRVSKVEDAEVLTLDLVIVPHWLESVWEARETYEWEGRRLTVVTREGLAEMKRIAGRAQDLADLERLEGPADE